MNTLFEIGLTNALVATLLALIIWAATRIWRQPALVHALWIIVLVKLVTPPMIAIPWNWSGSEDVADYTNRQIEPRTNATNAESLEALSDAQTFVTAENGLDLGVEDATTLAMEAVATSSNSESSLGSEPLPAVEERTKLDWSIVVAWVWLTGSVLWLVVSTLRVLQFHRALAGTEPATAELQRLAEETAAKLGVGRRFRLRVTEGRLSPLVWPVGRPTIVLSRPLIEQLSPAEIQTLLAHELAHLRRRDHWVRWLELAVTIIYWWHPVVWWARRQIRRAEEQACDAWTVWAFPEDARQYANSLFKAVQFVSESRMPAPLVASRLGGGNLKERIEHIMNAKCKRTMSRPAWIMVLFTAIIALPLSLRATQAVEQEAVPPRQETTPDAGQAPQKDAEPVQNPGTQSETTRAEVAAKSDGELSIRREQVAFLEEHAKTVATLNREGLRGGEVHRLSLASYELATAQGELAVAEGKTAEAITLFEQAQKHATDGLAASSAVYAAGQIDQEVVLQAVRNVANAKRRTLQAKANLDDVKGDISKVYKLDTVTPDVMVAVLNELGGPSPTTALGVDSVSNSLLVRGTAADHEKIALIIKQIERAQKDGQPADEAANRLGLAPGPYRISPGEKIRVSAVGVSPEFPIADQFVVEPGGTVALGALYGRVKVAGLTFEEAEKVITDRLAKQFKNVKVQVTLGTQEVGGFGGGGGNAGGFGGGGFGAGLFGGTPPPAPKSEANTAAAPAAGLDVARDWAQLVSSSQPVDSIGVLETIAVAKQQEFKRIQEAGGAGAVTAGELAAKKMELEISRQRLNQAKHRANYHRLLIALAETELQRAVEANKKTPSSVPDSDIRRLQIMVELTKARFQEFAE